MTDDAGLLRRYLADRSDTAFSELVQRHLKLVYFAALRQLGGDKHRAEDVTQAVFARLAAKAGSLVRHPSLAGWLFTATRFEAAHVMEAERRRQIREKKACLMNELLAGSDPANDWDLMRPVIDEILASLNRSDREIVLLRYFSNSPFAEIGTRCGISADAARFRLDRALEKMRIALGKRGMSSTAAALGLAFASQAEALPPAALAGSVAGKILAGSAASVTTALTQTGIIQLAMSTKLAAGIAAAVLALTAGIATQQVVTGYRLAQQSALETERAAALQGRLDALRAASPKASSGRPRGNAIRKL
jgi:RNA polymerase sigma factor (sigma-70 family)